VARGLRAGDRFIPADVVIAAADYHHVEQHLLAPEYRRYDEAYRDSRFVAKAKSSEKKVSQTIRIGAAAG